MKKVAIIQARTGSTRLPGKVLKDLGGRPVLQWAVDRARLIPGIDTVAVATSDAAADDAIKAWCDDYGVACYRGSEDDVLSRYVVAARAEQADVVMRITADCPFVDPQVSGAVLTRMLRADADYAANNLPASWPDGLDCEVMRATALYAADQDATRKLDREHVTPFIKHNRERFRVVTIGCLIPGLSKERWTIDDPEDLEFISAIVSRLPKEGEPTWMDVLAVLDAEPDLRKINAGLTRNEGLAKSVKAEPIPGKRVYDRSNAYLPIAESRIPLAAQTFSKSRIQLPQGQAPLFLTHGEAGRVWDVDGNEYVDLIAGLLAVLLGYNDPDVNEAIEEQLREGISFSLASKLESEVAERLCNTIPCAEKVRYGKNGSDANTGLVRIARHVTGRDHIIGCGYHGWQDWYIGGTPRNAGIPKAVRGLIHLAPYNDIDAMHKMFKDYKDDVACVIMEPMNAVWPREGYLEEVKELAHKNGALLIFDEVITGFRFANGGAQEFFGVTPDLASFGKGMANGMPISAALGRGDLMKEMEEIFFSSTFGGEALSLAAAAAVMDKMQREPVVETIFKRGTAMQEGAHAAIAEFGLSDLISLNGHPSWLILTINDHPTARKEAIKTRFLREIIRSGVLLAAAHDISYAHSEADVAQVVAGYREACRITAEELNSGKLEERLDVPVIEPVFKVR
ncbi:MAG: aminotransferase class III-fold pyridoxal phosphate-dependent enzyme [Rhodospirillales bacterium]